MVFVVVVVVVVVFVIVVVVVAVNVSDVLAIMLTALKVTKHVWKVIEITNRQIWLTMFISLLPNSQLWIIH